MIIPAILEKKLPALRKKLKLTSTFSKVAHIDIMDGRFVPNRTIPPSELKNAKTKLSVTVHLMSYYPEMYLHDLKDAGVKRVLVHVESTSKLAEVLMTGRSMGLQMGVVLNPRTSIKRVKPVSHLIKEILVMSVQPGFSGQRFRPSALIKIKKLSKLYPCEGKPGRGLPS